MQKALGHRVLPAIALIAVFMPLFVYGESNVPPEYREEIEAVLLSGKISSDVDEKQFAALVDALSQKAYNANVTGQDLTDARVESLLGSAITGFEANGDTVAIRQPNALYLWGALLGLIIALFVAHRHRRMYYGGALGAS